MATGDSYITCYQCGREGAHSTVDTKSYEYSIACPYCGYTYERRPLIDRKRTAEEANDRVFYFKVTKGGDLIFRTYERKGYGGWILGTSYGHAMGVFHCPVSENDIQAFRKMLERPGTDANRSFLSAWDDAKQDVFAVVGKLLSLEEVFGVQDSDERFSEVSVDDNEEYREWITALWDDEEAYDERGPEVPSFDGEAYDKQDSEIPGDDDEGDEPGV